MIKQYSDWEEQIVKMIKIRSANYVETDCDIEALIDTVYQDINNTVMLNRYKQSHLVQDVGSFTILNDDGDVGDPNSMRTRYTDVLDIVDEYDVSILERLHKTNESSWTWNNYGGCTDNGVPAHFVGETIYFIRKSVTEIDRLPLEMLSKLTNPMLEGIMYYIQTALPNQVDGQVGNWSYQRYFNAKKAIMNMDSQHVIPIKGERKWI